MPRLPRITYFILLLLTIVALTGCQMRRDSSDDLTTTIPPTPTLASLGVDNAEIPQDATPVPTIINVQLTATPSLSGVGQEAEKSSEPVAPTSQAPEMAITPIANPAQAANPETFVPPADTGEQPVIVSAPSSDLPDGGPVAANPPAGQPSSYAVPATENTGAAYGGSTYVVQSGDTLFAISMHYGTTVEDFMYANGLTSDFIYEGQVLTVPTRGDTPAYTDPPNYGQTPVGPGGNYNSGYYVVAPGDTLFSIAQWYGTSVEALAAANGLSYPYIIYEGQTLSISGYGAPPANGYYDPQQEIQPYPNDGYYQQRQQPVYPSSGIAGTHTVAPGETLFSIAQRYGTSAQAIAEANGLANPNQIYVGQVLYLP
jgi:LysM repeat protein